MDAFGLKQLQDSKALLQRLARRTVLIKDGIAMVEDELKARTSVDSRFSPSKKNVCPSCKKATMIRPKGVTETVLVCPRCRYSQYVGDRV